MKAPSKPFRQRNPSLRFLCVTAFLICAFLSHSLDNCAAHLGGLSGGSSRSSAAWQIKSPCPNTSGPCELCAPSKAPHQDGCDLLSEIAVLTPSSQHQSDHQAVTLGATVAVIPAIPQLIALSGCLHGRAGPPPALPASVFLRSSLPSRAPPISA